MALSKIENESLNPTLLPTQVASVMNATGSAPMYACRAWVNFNGTGTVAIRASGNVSSITDNGVGDYTVNFTTAMPDANYSVAGTVVNNGNMYGVFAYGAFNAAPTLQTTTQCRVGTYSNGGSADSGQVCLSIFR